MKITILLLTKINKTTVKHQLVKKKIVTKTNTEKETGVELTTTLNQGMEEVKMQKIKKKI